MSESILRITSKTCFIKNYSLLCKFVCFISNPPEVPLGAKSAFDDPRSKALERFLNPCNRPPPREYELLYFTVQHLKSSFWWLSLYDMILSKRQKITQKSFLIHPCDFTIHVIANHRGNMSCCTVLHLKFILFVVFFSTM